MLGLVLRLFLSLSLSPSLPFHSAPDICACSLHFPRRRLRVYRAGGGGHALGEGQDSFIHFYLIYLNIFPQCPLPSVAFSNQQVSQKNQKNQPLALLLPYYAALHSPAAAYVSIRQHTSAYAALHSPSAAYVSIRQHTSAYVSICGPPFACCSRERSCALSAPASCGICGLCGASACRAGGPRTYQSVFVRLY